jgi:hypothetical protein
MSNFSTKIFGLAGAAAAFAGMAFGQATCTANAAPTNIVRAEGTTELIAPTSFTCTVPPTATAAVAGTLSLQVFLNPALPITSKVLDSTGKTEAVATLGASSSFGTANGSTLNFTGLASPVTAIGGSFTVTISNIRVNATSINPTGGVPPTIAETAFVSGSVGSITPAALSFASVSFAQNGLSAAKIFKSFSTAAGVTSIPTAINVGSAGANSTYVICAGYSPKADGYTSVASSSTPKSLAFIIQVNENFTAAFKTIADEASTTPIAAAAISGSSVANNPLSSGTRIKLAFANVPANVTLLVPVGAISSSGASLAKVTLTGSEAGAISAVGPSGASSVNGNAFAAITTSAGSGVAVFEVTTDDLNNLDSFAIPVFISTTANGVAGSSTAITTTVSLGPIGSTNIPNFVSTASSTTLTGSTFNLCTTSLLFPFVTNQLGFDTGIAISNTSTDPFGGNGATAQAGACALNFYGAGAPSPSFVTSPNVPSGTTFTQVLSGVAPGFQGYMIAQCAFQYAHGFAFVTNGVGPTGGLSQGYLAGVIPDVNQVGRAANPLSAAAPGSGETLGN